MKEALTEFVSRYHVVMTIETAVADPAAVKRQLIADVANRMRHVQVTPIDDLVSVGEVDSRQLDRLVATKIMGAPECEEPPEYSRRPELAMAAMLKVSERTGWWEISNRPGALTRPYAMANCTGDPKDNCYGEPAVAMCLAALKAIGVDATSALFRAPATEAETI